MKTKALTDFIGGVNFMDLPTNIQDNQLIDSYNMLPINNVLKKRGGHNYVFETNEDGKVLSMVVYNNYLYIYTEKETTDAYQYNIYKINILMNKTSIYQYISETRIKNRGVFLKFLGNLYFSNKNIFLKILKNDTVYDNTSYNQFIKVPIIATNTSPDFSDYVEFEKYNKLTNRYSVQYNIVNTEGENYVNFYLPHLNSDNLDVSVKIYQNNTWSDVSSENIFTSTAYSTVLRKNVCKVYINQTLTDCENGIIITSKNNDADYKEYDLLTNDIFNIYNNSIVCSDGTEIHFSEPLNDGYFPEDPQFTRLIGNGADEIVGLELMGDDLIVFLKNSIYEVYNFTTNEGLTSYKIRLITSDVGCSDRYTIKKYNNNILFVYNNNIYILAIDNERGQKNAVKIDYLLNNYIKKKATSTEYYSVIIEDKYYLNIGYYVVVLDLSNFIYLYRETLKSQQKKFRYFIINNVGWNDGVIFNNKVYFGSSNNINLLKYSDNLTTDCGLEFEAHLQTKAYDFSLPNYYKYIENIYINVSEDTTAYVIKYKTDDDFDAESDAFNYVSFNYNQDNFYRARLRNIRNLSLYISSEDKFSLNNILIDYNITNKIR